jgi:hypothetical protein
MSLLMKLTIYQRPRKMKKEKLTIGIYSLSDVFKNLRIFRGKTGFQLMM